MKRKSRSSQKKKVFSALLAGLVVFFIFQLVLRIQTVLQPLGEVHFKFHGHALEITTSRLPLPELPGLLFKSHLGELNLKVRIWDTLRAKKLKIDKVVLRDLEIAIEPQLWEKSPTKAAPVNSQENPHFSFCTAVRKIESLIGETSVPLELDNIDLLVQFQRNHPLLIHQKEIEITPSLTKETCALQIRIQAEIPELTSSSVTIAGEILEKEEEIEVKAQTALKKLNWIALSDTVLKYYIPEIVDQLNAGSSEELRLQFHYSPKKSPTDSAFQLNGQVVQLDILHGALVKPLQNLHADFELQSRSFKMGVKTSWDELELSDFLIEIPLSTSAPILFQGQISGKSKVLSLLPSLSPFSKLFQSLSSIHANTRGQVSLPQRKAPSSSTPQISADIALENAVLDPSQQKEGSSAWNTQGHFQFEKSELKTAEVTLQSNLPKSLKSPPIHLSYLKKSDFSEISYREAESTRESITLHMGPSGPFHAQGPGPENHITVFGKASHSDLHHFMDLFELYEIYRPKFSSKNEVATKLFLNGSFILEHPRFSSFSLHPHKIEFKSSTTESHVSIIGKEIEGDVHIPADVLYHPKKRIHVYLNHLHLLRSLEEKKPSVSKADALPGDMSNIPGLSLFCKSLKIDQMNFGSVVAILDPMAQGLIAKEIVGESPSYSFFAQNVQWIQNPDQLDGHMVAELQIPKMKKFASDFGFESPLGDSQGQVLFNVHWKDLFLPTPETLVGKVTFTMTQGSVSMEGTPWQAILKLVSLDIGNIFTSDSGFSKFFGDLRLNNGKTEIKRAKIKFQPITLEVQGKIDFVAKNMDLLLEVTVKITNSFFKFITSPLIFMSNQLNLENAWIKRLNWLFTHQYKVSGPFDDFQVRYHKFGHLEPSK